MQAPRNEQAMELFFFQNSQTHTLVASPSCTTKTCYTKNHHHHHHKMVYCTYTTCAYTKHSRSTHYLNLQITCTCFLFLFFQCMCYNKFMFHSTKLVPWHVLCQPYLSWTLENISYPLKHTHFITLPFHLITQNLKHLGF